MYIWSYKFGWKATIQTQHDFFNGDTFLSLKKIHAKFPKCYLFMDKASHHITDQRRYKSILKKTRGHSYPSISSYCITIEFMVMEKVWNIAKRDLLVKYYSSFADFKEKISGYFGTKRFNLDMRNYLLRDV